VSVADHLDTIRSVHVAALGLRLACTEYVGPVSMAIALPTVRALAEPVPNRFRREVAAIEKRESRG
jgi:hypothetical protein